MNPVFFPDLPKLDPHGEATETWALAEAWVSQLVEGRAVFVKRGFITDGASIPRFFWRWIGHPLLQSLLGHALPHDALYASELVTRREADDFLLASMALDGVAWWRRNAIWLAVRIGGWVRWREHTPESIAAARRKVVVLGTPEYLYFRKLAAKN